MSTNATTCTTTDRIDEIDHLGQSPWQFVVEVYNSRAEWEPVATIAIVIRSSDEVPDHNDVSLMARELIFGYRGPETFALGTRSLGAIYVGE